MDPKRISQLAQLLRDKGDKILTSEFSFTVSGHFLRGLNDSFTLIADQNELCSPMSFQMVKSNNAKSDVFRDLQLIHDFVQKTPVLCVTRFPGEEDFEGVIDVSKFRSLQRLEVQKVNVKQIVGIQPLRAHLKQIVCVRSLENVEDIITYCGGDNSNGFVWNELKQADFSYNNLRSVDSSLEFAQWLHNLNLSRNQLISVDAIKWLPNLKVLNLSYNRLTHIPAFHTEAPRRLQILVLGNNFIEDLTGLSRLDSLNELDLSDNCLLDHNLLLPVSTLVALRYLNLTGNPLACHPKHRLKAAQYLNKNIASMKFTMDSDTLSKSEKAVIGSCQSYSNRISLGSLSSGLSAPRRLSQNHTPASSVGSIRSFRLSESTTSNEMTTSVTEKQKKAKVRTVVIEDDNPSIQASNYKEFVRPQVPEGCKDHLETKRQIDEMRNKFGSGWLQNENADMVRSVLGIENSPSKTRVSTQQFMDDILGSMTASAVPNADPRPVEEVVDKKETNVLSSTPNSNRLASKLETNQTSPIKSGNSPVTSETDTLYESVQTKSSDDPNDHTIYKSTNDDEMDNTLDSIYGTGNDEAEISEPDDTEVTYIVHQNDYSDEVFLAVSDVYIKERDILTRRTRTKWSLKILESCERIKGDTIRIVFDTVKKDKRERIFTVEEGLCQELEKCLRDILSKRQLSEMNQKLYKCVKCSMQFSRESNYKKTNVDVICPECGCIFVVELHERKTGSLTKNGTVPQYEELPVVVSNIALTTASQAIATSSKTITTSTSASNIAEQQSAGEKYVIEESASHSSIALLMRGEWKQPTNRHTSSSAGSLAESSSCSKITQSENSFDSNQSVAGSSTNDRDMDFNFNKNGESDIEILSNPSQSSIEVLDHTYGSRKTSEERRISKVTPLDTIEDNSYNSVPVLTAIVNNELATIQPRIEVTQAVEALTTSAEHVVADMKKISLGHVNLTESSSSGSVTDSICTAYEQEDKSATAVNSPAKGKNGNEKEPKKEDSIISSMFAGLFQSTNILMSRTQKSPQEDSTCEKFKFSYSDFSDADHRLKLHFYQNIFEDPNENFKWLVKSRIFSESGGNIFDGIVVMSTTRFYIMEMYGPERDDIGKWIRRVVSDKTDRIESIDLLPWKLGLAIALQGSTTYLILLQDILRTDSLLLFFANNPLPDHCPLEYQISQKLLKKIAFFTNEQPLRMTSILNQCDIMSDTIQKNLKPTGFFATDTHLYLTTSNFAWLVSSSEANIEFGHVQLMSNLIEVERPEKNIFTLNFLDEDQDKCELWTCCFVTQDNADSCLDAISQSWEKLFGVPLTSN